MLIGNLTRDPELRYTAQGTAVCNFGLATNRYWKTDTGEKKEATEFHRVVAWNKLAELCNQLLAKGRKVYVEGRLQTRTWTGTDGAQRTTTEIIVSDMVIVDSRKALTGEEPAAEPAVEPEIDVAAEEEGAAQEKKQTKKKPVEKAGEGEAVSTGKGDDQAKKQVQADDQDEPQKKKSKAEKDKEKVSPDEIPF